MKKDDLLLKLEEILVELNEDPKLAAEEFFNKFKYLGEEYLFQTDPHDGQVYLFKPSPLCPGDCGKGVLVIIEEGKDEKV